MLVSASAACSVALPAPNQFRPLRNQAPAAGRLLGGSSRQAAWLPDSPTTALQVTSPIPTSVLLGAIRLTRRHHGRADCFRVQVRGDDKPGPSDGMRIAATSSFAGSSPACIPSYTRTDRSVPGRLSNPLHNRTARAPRPPHGSQRPHKPHLPVLQVHKPHCLPASHHNLHPVQRLSAIA